MAMPRSVINWPVIRAYLLSMAILAPVFKPSPFASGRAQRSPGVLDAGIHVNNHRNAFIHLGFGKSNMVLAGRWGSPSADACKYLDLAAQLRP